MKYIIINADDFGRSDIINSGIIDAHEHGVVTNATLMVTGDCFEKAVQLAKKHPNLHIGLHLDLSAFFIIKHGVGMVVGYREPRVSEDMLAKEIEKQISTFQKTGLPLSHLDSHYHIHLREEIFPLVIEKAHTMHIKTIRWFPQHDVSVSKKMQSLIKQAGLNTTDYFVTGWNFEKLHTIPDGKTIELMTHPALVSKNTDAWRYQEWHTACAEKTKRFFKENGYTCSTFQLLNNNYEY